jgi:hypothetical protein
MTRAQLEFRAELHDGRLVEVMDKVQAGDYLNWAGEYWVVVEKGSSYVGQFPDTLKFLRIVPKEQ